VNLHRIIKLLHLRPVCEHRDQTPVIVIRPDNQARKRCADCGAEGEPFAVSPSVMLGTSVEDGWRGV
jgi:hypothetical protein